MKSHYFEHFEHQSRWHRVRLQMMRVAKSESTSYFHVRFDDAAMLPRCHYEIDEKKAARMEQLQNNTLISIWLPFSLNVPACSCALHTTHIAQRTKVGCGPHHTRGKERQKMTEIKISKNDGNDDKSDCAQRQSVREIDAVIYHLQKYESRSEGRRGRR